MQQFGRNAWPVNLPTEEKEWFAKPCFLSNLPAPCPKLDPSERLLHLSSSPKYHSKHFVGIEKSDILKSKVIGFQRKKSKFETIAEIACAEPNIDHRSKLCATSCLHLSSQSLVHVFAHVKTNSLSVEHGIVVVEILYISIGKIKYIALTQFPGVGTTGIQNSRNSNGSLANIGLKVTTSSPLPPPKEYKMPACINCCEAPDGRLALLFCDGHIRLLEIRLDKLAVQYTLFSSIIGHPQSTHHERSDESNEQLTSEYDSEYSSDEFSEDDGDSDPENSRSPDKRSENSRGRGNGKGKGRGKGRGKGGRKGRKKRGNKLNAKRRKGMESESKAGASRILQNARKIANETARVQRTKLKMDNIDEERYDELFAAVEGEINQLRVVLQSIEANEKERVWLRGKTSGELDDRRLVDFAIGEKNVFKKRGEKESSRMVQRLPKRVSFVVDVSGSMAYFNGDQRLDRLCATVVMLMEALTGLDHKYQYEIIGHSGETHELCLVPLGKPPINRHERLAVVQNMVDHAASCSSGDNTGAAIRAMEVVRREEADDYFVFLISDANLEMYGVTPELLAQELMRDKLINAYAIFIAEPEVALEMQKRMPAGRAHVCNNNEEMPFLFKSIFSRAVLK